MKNIFTILVLITFISCSKGGSSDDGPTEPPIVAPSAANLIFPENNQECNQGTQISAAQTAVDFQWEASANTDSYEIHVKNLDTDITSTLTSFEPEKTITINKATPYSWYVVSKSTTSQETAQSATWKFYNAGEAILNYAPFPADLIAPSMGANLSGVTSVVLEWNGSDVDNDIEGYDVYFDTFTPPTTLIGADQTEMTTSVDVTAGNTYYWKIITKDSAGNNSETTIFQFKVD